MVPIKWSITLIENIFNQNKKLIARNDRKTSGQLELIKKDALSATSDLFVIAWWRLWSSDRRQQCYSSCMIA